MALRHLGSMPGLLMTPRKMLSFSVSFFGGRLVFTAVTTTPDELAVFGALACGDLVSSVAGVPTVHEACTRLRACHLS